MRWKNYLTKICASFLGVAAFVLPGFAQSVLDEEGERYMALHPGIVITHMEDVMDGKFVDPSSQKVLTGLPPFRRIALIARPVPDSDIRIEVWMPIKNWNGRFLGTGNNGGAGRMNYDALRSGLDMGFAVANTDMGTSPAARLVYDYPERWKDFGYRATHEMTVIVKKFIQEYYQETSFYSYFQGCSTGGQQALSEAQRYPEDYDGLLAGAPANNRTHLHVMFLWCHALCNEDAELMFTQEQLRKITEIAIRKNAGKDGGAPTDNFLTDPRMAVVDFEDFASFLSERQIEVLKKIMSGPVNPVTGEQIYCPYPVNSGDKPLGQAYFQSESAVYNQFYPFVWAFGKDFDYRQFDFDQDMAKMDSILAPLLNANDPDLNPLKERNGKILMYTGTCDPIVPFLDAIHYYERVVKEVGSLEETQDFFRYFIIPGMGHCGGGPGMNSVAKDMLAALMNWVERNEAPEYVIATRYKEGSKGVVEMRRPVFPYPDFPEYVGGNPAMPQNYKRVAHPRGNVVVPAERYLE